VDYEFDFYRVFNDPKELLDEHVGRGNGNIVAPKTGLNVCVYKGWGNVSGPVLIVIGKVIYEARYGVPEKPIYIIENEYIYRAKNALAITGVPLFWIDKENRMIREMYYNAKTSGVVYYWDEKYVYKPFPFYANDSTKLNGEKTGDIYFTLE